MGRERQEREAERTSRHVCFGMRDDREEKMCNE
jgi:hypothetical protein